MIRIFAALALIAATIILCASVPVPAHAEATPDADDVEFIRPDQCDTEKCTLPLAQLEHIARINQKNYLALKYALEALAQERASKTKHCATVERST